MSIAVQEKLSWDERIKALSVENQKLVDGLVTALSKVDAPQSEQYSKEWYIAEIQKGLDSADRGEVRDFEEATEEILVKLGL